uniref:Uncharacterized protein n=1 Tax=Anguilla anguilla TaxID=7936 RepID=A0A0E9URH7_ANGAN
MFIKLGFISMFHFSIKRTFNISKPPREDDLAWNRF